MKIDNKVAVLQNLFILLTLISVCAAYVNYNLGVQEFPYYRVTSGMSDGVAWTIVSMLIIYMLFRGRMFHELTESSSSKWYYKCAFVALMVSMTIMDSILVGSQALFQTAYIPIILTGMIGGPVYVVVVSAISLLIHVLFLHNCMYLQAENYVDLLVIAATAISVVLGLLKKYKIWYVAPLLLAAIYAFFIPSMISEWHQWDHPEQLWTLYIWSDLSILIFGYLALVLFYKYMRLIETQENVKRAEHDFVIARDIQLASLPAEFPITRSLDIYGIMVPATEVAGDFYDCFAIRRNLTAFVVADVSDKGLPASLMMMSAMGALRATAMLRNDPGRILTAFNKEICSRNAAEQFITVWMGIYDSDTGVLQYANAGHPPPMVRHLNGSFEKLPVKKGLMIGVNRSIHYKTDTIALSDVDTFFCYTDGVNEAFNEAGEQFGRERLENVLNSVGDNNAKSIVKAVQSAVKEFVGTWTQSDDITMLCFIVNRPQYHKFVVPRNVEELVNINAFLESQLVAQGFKIKDVLKMEIVAEEIFVNICDHSKGDQEGDVTVYCSSRDNEIKLTFADSSESFNPLNLEEITIDENLSDWPIGGFGIHMIKKLVTYADYKYFNGQNIFTVWKKLDCSNAE